MADEQPMTKMLRNPGPSELIKAIEDNTINSLLTWTKWAKIEVHEDADVVWIASDIPYFLFNLVLPTEKSSLKPGSPPGSLPGSSIDAAISRAISRNMPVGCWVGPSNPFPEFRRHLEIKGFVHGAALTGMAIDLPTLDENAPRPRGLTISEVKNSDALVTWCQIMTTVSEFPDFAASAWVEMYREIGICEDPDWRLYVGDINGTPVGTSALFFNAGVAGIHSVTTLPQFRGRGIGTTLTQSPLLDARREGFQVGVLYASEMAVDLYRKLGFQEYCNGDIYLWQPAEGEPAP